MKKFLRLSILSEILFSMSFAICAQSFTDHTPRDGDRLHPGLSANGALILVVNDSSRTVLIEPSSVSFDDELDAYAYIDTDTISYVQSATKHRFILRGDTLSYLGYENHQYV